MSYLLPCETCNRATRHDHSHDKLDVFLIGYGPWYTGRKKQGGQIMKHFWECERCGGSRQYGYTGVVCQ